MQFLENYSLKSYNTFRIGAQARYFTSFTTVDQLQEALDQAGGLPTARPPLVLGGGSNVLLTGDIDGVVLHNGIKGITLADQDDEFFYVRAGGGEVWHQLVLHCIEKGYAGVENMSLIPGCVGASPIQNIGAYGVELKDVFYELEAWHIADKELHRFSLADCGFGYRESVFKRKYKGQYIITGVTLRLRREPVFHTSYGAIEHELQRMGVQELSIRAISDAVIHIRQSKLPDPEVTGNAGSFFKNPSIPYDVYEQLKVQHPSMPAYTNADGSMKLAAGWLIEQCGWKGFRRGDAGCHIHQALVLVNYGNATGKEIYDLSQEIIESVLLQYGVLLEREVNII